MYHQNHYSQSSNETTYLEKAMGSTFSYKCFPNSNFSRPEIIELFKLAHNEVRRIQAKFTEFSDSLITRINANAGVEWTYLDDETYFLLKEAIKYSKETEGLFSLSISTISLPWKMKRRNGEKLSKNERSELLKYVDDDLIKFDDLRKRIYLPKQEMKIGLGGLGKGYAVDRAFSFLKSKGLVNFCVNGGGDLRVHSLSNAPRPWKIGIANPFSESQKYVGYVKLKNESLSTSGSYRQKHSEEDHHIIHPKLGVSEKIIKSASLISSSTMMSDAYCTAIMNMQWNQAINWMQRMNLRGVLIHQNGYTYSH